VGWRSRIVLLSARGHGTMAIMRRSGPRDSTTLCHCRLAPGLITLGLGLDHSAKDVSPG
jgi:hypothetical protein